MSPKKISDEERADRFLGEKVLQISEFNQRFLNSYLSEVKKRSTVSYRTNKYILKEFFENVEGKITEITMKDVRDYFKFHLDTKERDLGYKTKNTHRSFLSSFFDHCAGILLDNEEVDFRNPVPNSRIWDFTKREDDVKSISEEEKERIEIGEINEILTCLKRNYNHKKQKRYFIYYGFLAFCGARPEEILTTRMRDVHLEKGYFETGFEKNAKKSTLHTNRALLFFIPEGFIKYLKNYMLIFKGEKYLFPSSWGEHLTQQGLQYTKRNLQRHLGYKWKYKWFRRTLITEYTKNECPDGYREGIMNHVGQSVEWEHYIKLSISERRKIFDKYFPYYGKIPYF